MKTHTFFFIRFRLPSTLRRSKRDVFIRFRWSSVDGGKRCENANVDVNTFMCFQETENGGFENALVWTGPEYTLVVSKRKKFLLQK